MSDLRKQRRGNPWRDHLTPDEVSELAAIDAKIQALRTRARRLSFKRVLIQNRATQRARQARS
jgi:hypothetical protein